MTPAQAYVKLAELARSGAFGDEPMVEMRRRLVARNIPEENIERILAKLEAAVWMAGAS